jgi:hypothetical protein
MAEGGEFIGTSIVCSGSPVVDWARPAGGMEAWDDWRGRQGRAGSDAALWGVDLQGSDRIWRAWWLDGSPDPENHGGAAAAELTGAQSPIGESHALPCVFAAASFQNTPSGMDGLLTWRWASFYNELTPSADIRARGGNDQILPDGSPPDIRTRAQSAIHWGQAAEATYSGGRTHGLAAGHAVIAIPFSHEVIAFDRLFRRKCRAWWTG